MLANNKPVQDVDLANVFAAMIGELPWKTFKEYIQSSAQLLKRCSVGGHRTDNKKFRKRFEKIVLKEAEKAEYSQEFCSAAFAFWYPVHENLHTALENFFHSEEYEKLREEQDLEEDAYVLPDNKFDELFDVKDVRAWRILLCFSPLQFTEEQAQTILSDSAGNETLVDQIKELQQKLKSKDQENVVLQNENQEIRARLKELGEEGQQLRNERKQLKSECTSLGTKFESAQAENRRIREELTKREEHLTEHKQKAVTQINKETNRLSSDLQRLSDELETWKSKYEDQRVENRELSEKISAMEKAVAEARQDVDKSRKELAHSHRFADLILGQLDWPAVGSQMQLTPQLKRKFNSLIKKLSYEEDRTLSLGTTLDNFWKALQKEETDLIEAIAHSDSREVESGDVENFWLGLTDTFEDVQIALEAREILLQMLQDIFYQTINMEDLEKGTAPGAATAKRREDIQGFRVTNSALLSRQKTLRGAADHFEGLKLTLSRASI